MLEENDLLDTKRQTAGISRHRPENKDSMDERSNCMTRQLFGCPPRVPAYQLLRRDEEKQNSAHALLSAQGIHPLLWERTPGLHAPSPSAVTRFYVDFCFLQYPRISVARGTKCSASRAC